MTTQDNQNDKQSRDASTGEATQKEQEMADEQKGGQGSKGGADQHGAHGKQATNPHGNLPSGQDGNQGKSPASGSGNG